MKTLQRIVLAVGLTLTAPALVPAAGIIVQPTAAAATSNFNSETGMINGTGFSGPDQATIAGGQTAPGVWPTSDGTFPSNWVSGVQGGSNTSVNNPNFSIVYTLSATPVDIASMHYWAYDGDSTGRDLQSFSLSFSNDGVNYSTPQAFTGLPQTTDNTGTPGIDLTLTSPALGVEFAKISNITNFGSVDSFGSFYGIQEVRFVTAVPEPSTALLATLGIAGLLCVARRARKA